MTQETQMSGAQSTYMMLKTFKDKTEFTMDYMIRALPDYTSGSIGNILYRLSNVGALSHAKNSTDYTVNANKLANWGAKKKWSRPRDPDMRTAARKALGSEASNSDVEVLGDLLSAMLLAEPVIRKYQKLAKAFGEISG